MRKLLLASLFVMAGCFAASAQNNFTTPGGAGVGGSVTMCLNSAGQGIPCGGYQYQSSGAGQYGVAITSVQTLTVPSGSLIAEICVETATARYTTTGTTPSSTVGIPVASGGCFQLAGAVSLAAFKIIGAGATLSAEYFK